MWVGEIDVREDDQVRAFWAAAMEGDAHERPYAAFWSLQAAKVAFRAENNTVEQHPFVAKEGDEVVGANQIVLPTLDNTHVAYMTPITRPAYRRRGVGSALLEAGLGFARACGRTTVIIEVNLPATDSGPGVSDGSRLLARHGFAEASLELHRVLELPVAGSKLEALAAEAAPYHEGYRFVPIAERVPDELLAGYCALQEAFNSEAPLGDLDIEPEVWNEERVRGAEERFRLAGRYPRGMAALAPEGEMVALTEMMATSHQPDLAWQSGTLVLKGHRGHRLGLAIKVANLLAFQADFPDCRIVHSWNAEENGPMVAINDRLGFRPVEYLSEMQLRL